MKIVFEGEDIIGAYSDYVGLQCDLLKDSFLVCLPRDSDGLFCVSCDGEEFVSVSKDRLWNYPIVRINWYNESADEYEGVNDQGISLLAFDIPVKKIDEYELRVGVKPSYISVWRGKVQLIFRINDFIPEKASESTWAYLKSVISYVGEHTQGEYIDEVINPLCDEVKSYAFNVTGLSLKEINRTNRIRVSKEHKALVRRKGQKAGAESRVDNTRQKILDAKKTLEADGDPVTVAAIAKKSGLTRPTVYEHLAELNGHASKSKSSRCRKKEEREVAKQKQEKALLELSKRYSADKRR